MFSDSDSYDSTRKFFESMAHILSVNDGITSDFYSLYFKGLLEFQRNVLKSYQKIVEEGLNQGRSNETTNVLKELMTLYVDFVRLQRENRENFMKAHASLIQNQLDFVEDTLKKLHEKKL